MSSDQYGFPQRKTDFEKDVFLSGQSLTIGGHPNMQRDRCWSRMDSSGAIAATGTPYMSMQLDPLPAGSVIRASGIGTATSDGATTGSVGLDIALDPLRVTSSNKIIISTADGGATSYTGPFCIEVYVRGRNSVQGSAVLLGTGSPGAILSTVTISNTPDFGVSNTLLVALNGAGAASFTVQCCFVEVFVPRVYR